MFLTFCAADNLFQADFTQLNEPYSIKWGIVVISTHCF